MLLCSVYPALQTKQNASVFFIYYIIYNGFFKYQNVVLLIFKKNRLETVIISLFIIGSDIISYGETVKQVTVNCYE